MSAVPGRRAGGAIALAALLAAATAPRAQETPADAAPAVRVTGDRFKSLKLPPSESTTVIDASVIERKQSATIFDVVKDAPGVSVDGGPRATGMKFNIRGFRGNDDVVFKIDGGVKGFEKYRFGSGVFIEPELIKSITIERGPSILTGSGAIGGAVIATTKSAVDFLRPGERAGALVKLGYNDNSRERLRMVTVFGRLTDQSDLLVSQVWRDGADIKLANGQRMPASATHLRGSLIKLGLSPIDDLVLELSRTAYDSGPVYTPFDTNSSSAGVGGYVHQTIADETVNLRFSYDPARLPWLKLRGAVAHETTALNNLMKTGAGQSTMTSPCVSTPCDWSDPANANRTGEMTDFWRYDIWTAEVFNDTHYRISDNLRGVLTLGLQAVHNRRALRRVTENPFMNLPTGEYPDGFDRQQPSGTKSSLAWIAQNAFHWRDFSVVPGVRWDRYRLSANGQAALDLQAAGESSTFDFTHTTPSLSLTWRPGGGAWWLTHRWIKSFRPPQLTDYFGSGASNPCGGLKDSNDQPIASYACGNRIVPTESLNRELTLAWTPARDAAGAGTHARLTVYQIDSSHLNGADWLRAQGDQVVQPFSERRRGLELEAMHERRWGYAGFTLSRVLARRANGLDGTSADFYRGIPGTTAGFNAGLYFFERTLELGYRIRQVHDQLVSPGAKALNATTQYCGTVTPKGVVHAANTQQDVFAIWRPSRAFTLQAGVYNLFNKHWCNNGDELGNTIGLQGPGRSARVSMTVQY